MHKVWLKKRKEKCFQQQTQKYFRGLLLTTQSFVVISNCVICANLT